VVKLHAHEKAEYPSLKYFHSAYRGNEGDAGSSSITTVGGGDSAQPFIHLTWYKPLEELTLTLALAVWRMSFTGFMTIETTVL
jgi:hypothetical protein